MVCHGRRLALLNYVAELEERSIWLEEQLGTKSDKPLSTEWME